MENESVGCDSCPAMMCRPELPSAPISVEFSTPYQENDPLTKGKIDAHMAEAAPIAPVPVEDSGRVEYFDVLIVGAGLSGIGAAYHLQTKCPAKTYAILDGRSRDRGNLGLVPLPGCPFRFRHAYARLPVSSLVRQEGDRLMVQASASTSSKRLKNMASTARFGLAIR